MVVRFSVSFPAELLEELDSFTRRIGIKSRSEALRLAVTQFISTNRWRLAKGRIAGILLVLYDHETHGLEEELTEIQHRHLDIVVSALHVHISKRECMLAIVVKGDASMARKLYENIARLRGIRQIQYSIITY